MLLSLCGPRASAKPIGPILYKTVLFMFSQKRYTSRYCILLHSKSNPTPATIFISPKVWFPYLGYFLPSRGKQAKPAHNLQTS